MVKLLIISCLIFVFITTYALCKASSIADEREQIIFEKWKNNHLGE